MLLILLIIVFYCSVWKMLVLRVLSYVLFVFLLFYVLDVVSITVYDRDIEHWFLRRAMQTGL